MKQLLLSIIKILQEIIKFLQKQITSKKGFQEFADALGKRESGNNYQIVNAYGYLGKYQFGMARLCDLGYTERKAGTTGFANVSFVWKRGYSQEYFLNNSDFQEKVFKEHCEDLIKVIKAMFSIYLGQVISNVEITLSGCVAGAHLAGIGGLGNFLTKAYDSSDAFGTKISDYIRDFADYNLIKNL